MTRSLPAAACLACLFAIAAHAPADSRTAELRRTVMTRGGDAEKGKALFTADTLKCAVCHTVRGQGGEAGPDLSNVAGKLDRTHLIESLLEPSAQILEGFRTTIVQLDDGRVLDGVVREESDDGFTLIDANNAKTRIATPTVKRRKTSEVSLMPEGLATTLSAEQFADLIAYLETLRASRPPSPGEGITGAITVPDGFEVDVVATSLTGCTALAVAPDGRVFVCEQTGTLRVVKEGKLLAEPFAKLPVEASFERGLIGVTVAPDFPTTPHVFVCYVAREPYLHHVVGRFTADGDVAEPGSETILLEGDDQRTLGGHFPGGHQGGALHFGADGKLYIAIGEQTARTPAQRLDTLLGKLLRIDPDGSIPSDNPFYNQTNGKYRAIWAVGLRNPYTFAFQPGTDRMFVNDVGDVRWEEINEGVAGGNYGWPLVEGTGDDPKYINPVHVYGRDAGTSIGGGAFCPDDSRWPEPYRGKYFFAEFTQGSIRLIDPKHPRSATTFATGFNRPIDIRFAPDGSLYVLVRNAWLIDEHFQPGTGSLLRVSARARSRSH